MLASLHPTSPTSDQAVRDLLDQRARASHTRYTSVSFSQRSDSPSIYSRGDISPNPMYAPLEQLPLRPGHTMSTGQSAFDDVEEDIPRPVSPASSLSHGEHYFPVDDDENDNDGTSFISAPTPRPLSHREVDPLPASGSELESTSTDKVEEDSRMSLLGPKMRFVSRAPWETGEDDLPEADEESNTTDTASIFGGKVGGWRARDSDKSSIKGLGLATLRSRSPGPPSAAAKRGGIAMNFGLSRYKSSDPPSENPHRPYISGPSQSQNVGLSSMSSARSSHSVTDSQSSHKLSYKASIPRVASGPISAPPQADAVPPLPSPKPYTSRTPKASLSSYDDSSISSFQSESPPPMRFMHPYANPDLIPAVEPLPQRPRTPRKNQDQWNEERDRHTSPGRRQSESSQSSSPRSANPRKSPVSSVVPPAEQKDDGPMRSLISLEQARARAHNSSRPSSSIPNMGDAPPSRSAPTSTLVAGLGLAPGVVVENDVVRGQTQRSPMIPFPQSDAPVTALPNQGPQRQRLRTMSSGKHKGGAGSGATTGDGDGAPVKTLKHKKSAFMKLFQGGKDKEREKEQQKDSSFSARPPDVRAVSTPPQMTSNDRSSHPFPGTLNIKRVPPPLPLSVVVTSPSVGTIGSLGRTTEASTPRPDSPPRLRQASSPIPSSGENQESSSSEPWLPSDARPPAIHLSPLASSAPSSQTEFKALSLRPISTMFSANFPELLSPSSPQSNPLTAWNQSASPTTPSLDYSRSNSMSTASDFPITPISGKPYTGGSNIMSSSTEDQSAIIATLQEQIINSRKAWQRQIWELEGQVKDLKAEVEDLRSNGECETCGKAKRDGRIRTPAPQTHGVVHRPRPRMGGNTRSVFGGANDM